MSLISYSEKEDDTNQMNEFFEQFGISNENYITNKSHERKDHIDKTNIKSDKIAAIINLSKRKYFIFEGCSSIYDQISFVPYNGEVQSSHYDIKKYTKKAVLNPNRRKKDEIDNSLFRDFAINEIYASSEHAKKVLDKDFKAIEASVVIKLGFEYFFSRFFRWNKLITIDELSLLSDIKAIPSKNYKYYIKPKFEPKNEYFGTLQSSFTDHESIDETNDFKSFVFINGFEAVSENIITYRIIISNRNQIIKNLINGIAIDDRVKKTLIDAKTLLLKFDSDFKLREIDLSDESKISNIDIISNNDKKFDIRVKMRTEAFMNKDSVKCFFKIQEAFEGFITVDRQSQKLTIKCSYNDIRFVRKSILSIYKDQNQNSTFDLRINSFIEFQKTHESNHVDNVIQYEPSIQIKSHIRMKAPFDSIISQLPTNFNPEGCKEKKVLSFCNDLWSRSLWLSNIASNFKNF